MEASAKTYNASTGTWKITNGYIFVNGEKQNFYGAVVDDIVLRLENRGIAMKPGVSAWDDIFTDTEMIRRVLANDASVTALLGDEKLKNLAKSDSRVLAAIKNYGTYGKAALTYIKNNPSLKREFLALSAPYSNTSDFNYLLTCNNCNSTGSIYKTCPTCHGDAFVGGDGIYFKCSECDFFSTYPNSFDHCPNGHSISSGGYISMKPCPTCNADASRSYWFGAYYYETCSGCGGKGCHF